MGYETPQQVPRRQREKLRKEREDSEKTPGPREIFIHDDWQEWLRRERKRDER